MRPSRLLAAFALASLAFGLNNPWVRVSPWTGVFLWAAAAFLERAADVRRGDRPWYEAKPGELLFLGSLALYLSTFRWKGGDDIPTSLLPFCILRHGTISLEPFRGLFSGELKNCFTVEGPRQLLSVYPVASSVLALP